MRRRTIRKLLLVPERLEDRQLLSTTPSTVHLQKPKAVRESSALHARDGLGNLRTARGALGDRRGVTRGGKGDAGSRTDPQVTADRRRPEPVGAFGYLAFRVTNTSFQTPYKLVPPFQQVLVQARQPVPGQVYNVGYVTVKNGTSQTFTAGNGFTVRMTNQPRSFGGFPILTGNEQWKPGQILVFYVLTKKYYPVSFVAGGFQLDLGGRSSTLVPGPAGIFLRLKYDPATFERTLNWIVAFGPGNEAGQGAKFGLPNTAINEIVDARTRRMDFAGHF
jgi:hypothetical protein